MALSWRDDSTASTPGRRASCSATRSSAGSVSQTETSLRIASVKLLSTITSIASRKKLPITTMATAAATPTMPIPVRRGRRSMLRRIIRSAGLSRVRPRRSATVGLNCPGADGRIASAGVSRTVARIADKVPATAVMAVMLPASATKFGETRCVKLGK